MRWTIIAAIFMVSLSVCYFLIIYLPQNNRNKLQASQVENCTEMGIKAFQDEQKLNSSVSEYLNPQYKYSSKFHACLYKSGFINTILKSEYVIDLYTNKEITSYMLPIDQSKWTQEQSQSYLDFNSKSIELLER